MIQTQAKDITDLTAEEQQELFTAVRQYFQAVEKFGSALTTKACFLAIMERDPELARLPLIERLELLGKGVRQSSEQVINIGCQMLTPDLT